MKGQTICILLLVVTGLCVPVLAQNTILVDDDGAQCPGAVRTIRGAVSRAAPGSTILVCPGTYRGEVEIRGADRNDIKLIAVGPPEGVVVGPQSTSDCAGFTLRSVSGVLIRGFTISGFRCAESTPSQFGSGSSIRLLEDANENVIEHNRMSNTGMFGVRLVDASSNIIQNNTIYSIDAVGFGCGIMSSGPKAHRNLYRTNYITDTPGAGMMIRDGEGSIIVGNTLINNGRYGLEIRGAKGYLVEGNRITDGPGYWGLSPAGTPGSLESRGIHVEMSEQLIINLNQISGNSGLDIFWDGNGKAEFAYNSCGLSNQEKLCSRVTSCPPNSRCAAKEGSMPNYDMMY